MVFADCSFATDRLSVAEWHRSHGVDAANGSLAQAIAATLTPAVTRPMPTGWQGQYTAERAERWIAERDRDGPTLLVSERATGQAIGLMILHETSTAGGSGIDARLGYLLSEPAWGTGLGSELVSGFVAWCRGSPLVRSITGGVAADNVASARILEKNDFILVSEAGSDPGAEATYELVLRP
jgi:ribosomal-protein-alanine N-acetyltransferase